MPAPPAPLHRLATRFQQFLQTESAGGVVLMACTALALLWANSPWQQGYFGLWQIEFGPRLGAWGLRLDLHDWINDGLMALFFLLVGLEIKRELLAGEISTVRKAMLPLLSALGGMLVPALLYLLLNHGTEHARGWGVPVATDIAFALAVLALLGKRVPLGLKVFLTALAIVDDMGAVIVIALFYTAGLNLPMLLLGAGCLGLCALLNRLGIAQLWPYLLIGALAWYAVLQSGVHATVAGVLLALCIPLRTRAAADTAPHNSPLERLEQRLHYPVAFGILPLFALANAGVNLSGVKLPAELFTPVSLGIILGLLLGKQLGVTLFAWLAVRLKLAALPAGVDWLQLYATAWICGIGFTMSLFIANLAFGPGSALLDTAKLGILCASLLAGSGGYLLLRWRLKPAA